MPIADCLICDSSIKVTEEIISLWSGESGFASEHMTVNVSQNVQQFGRAYKIMCRLYLPTAWGRESIDALQLGLSRALVKCCRVKSSEIHIITQSVQSGMVVENGSCQTW